MWKFVPCWAFRLMRRWLANVFILTLQHNSTITCRVPQASFEQHLLSQWYRNILFVYYTRIKNCDKFCYSVWLSNYHFLQIRIHLMNQSTHSFDWCGTWILQVAVKLDDGTYSEAAKENIEGSLIWTAGDKCKIAENLIKTQKRKKRERKATLHKTNTHDTLEWD